MSIQWKFAVEKYAADRFIDRVVAADVLSNDERFAIGGENSSGMNPAGACEIRLLLAQQRRKREQRFDVDPKGCRSNRRKVLTDRVDAFLPAQSATARDGAEALRGIQICFHVR